MSTFLAKSFETIVAYEPGEQLGDDYLKLNANESSQEPSPRVLEVLKNAQTLNYYNDPCQHKLRQAMRLISKTRANSCSVISTREFSS